jgi:hypothetical protein
MQYPYPESFRWVIVHGEKYELGKFITPLEEVIKLNLHMMDNGDAWIKIHTSNPWRGGQEEISYINMNAVTCFKSY